MHVLLKKLGGSVMCDVLYGVPEMCDNVWQCVTGEGVQNWSKIAWRTLWTAPNCLCLYLCKVKGKGIWILYRDRMASTLSWSSDRGATEVLSLFLCLSVSVSVSASASVCLSR